VSPWPPDLRPRILSALPQVLREVPAQDEWRQSAHANSSFQDDREQGFRTSSVKSPNAVGPLRDLVMLVVLQLAARGRNPQAWMRGHHVDWQAPAGSA
jgi:hypothetical protein